MSHLSGEGWSESPRAVLPGLALSFWVRGKAQGMVCVQWGPARMGVARRRGQLAGLAEGTVQLQSLQGRGGWPPRTGLTRGRLCAETGRGGCHRGGRGPRGRRGHLVFRGREQELWCGKAAPGAREK